MNFKYEVKHQTVNRLSLYLVSYLLQPFPPTSAICPKTERPPRLSTRARGREDLLSIKFTCLLPPLPSIPTRHDTSLSRHCHPFLCGHVLLRAVLVNSLTVCLNRKRIVTLQFWCFHSLTVRSHPMPCNILNIFRKEYEYLPVYSLVPELCE